MFWRSYLGLCTCLAIVSKHDTFKRDLQRQGSEAVLKSIILPRRDDSSMFRKRLGETRSSTLSPCSRSFSVTVLHCCRTWKSPIRPCSRLETTPPWRNACQCFSGSIQVSHRPISFMRIKTRANSFAQTLWNWVKYSHRGFSSQKYTILYRATVALLFPRCYYVV